MLNIGIHKQTITKQIIKLGKCYNYHFKTDIILLNLYCITLYLYTYMLFSVYSSYIRFAEAYVGSKQLNILISYLLLKWIGFLSLSYVRV